MPNFSGKWSQNQILYNDLGFYKVPGAPTSVSATDGNTESVVSFTAPTYAGIPATITGYRVRATVQSGRTIAVTVADAGSGNKYNMDGSAQPTLTLIEGYTYTFDQSDASNSGHPFRFSTTSDGTHGSGSEYTTGVTTSGTPGNAGAYTRIVVAADAPTLYYYCTVHSGMGGTANTSTFNVEVTGSASPLTLTGLTNQTTYDIAVQAQNLGGYGDAGTTTATPSEPPQTAYTTAGAYTFVVPAGLNPATISLVAIGGAGGDNSGGGGGGGGGLGYKNGISVTAGTSYSVFVGARSNSTAAGGDSYLNYGGTYIGANGGGGPSGQTGGTGGGNFGCDGGGSGGNGGSGSRGGGGGAGGYSGAGGAGGGRNGQYAGYDGSGGGAGGGYAGSQDGGGGGGTGIFGEGSSGAGATTYSTPNSYTYGAGGGGGSGGGDGRGAGGASPNGDGAYGGGAGSGSNRGTNAHGAVRIIYSFNGTTRAFPSTNTGDL